MSEWSPIAAVNDCPPGSIVERIVAGRVVALANVDGVWHAIDGLCPHQGGPIGRGRLCGSVVTCPWHGWQFDVASGRHGLSPTVRQECFPVREEGGRVFVRVGAAGGDGPTPPPASGEPPA